MILVYEMGFSRDMKRRMCDKLNVKDGERESHLNIVLIRNDCHDVESWKVDLLTCK